MNLTKKLRTQLIQFLALKTTYMLDKVFLPLNYLVEIASRLCSK